MKVALMITIISMLFFTNLDAQNLWIQTVGDGNYEWKPESAVQTRDGGFVAAGTTGSFGEGYDGFCVKLDASGQIVWQKRYSASAFDYFEDIQETSDGGFIVAGSTSLFGPQRAWLLKLNANGNIQWHKSYGGYLGHEVAYSVRPIKDGYVFAGKTESYGAGKQDAWIVKVDNSGRVIWQQAIGGKREDIAFSIRETNENGFIVAGRTASFGSGGTDFWCLRLDSSGKILWQQTYGGKKADGASSVQQTIDGGFILFGYSSSFGAGREALLLKLSENGIVQWKRSYGGNKTDLAAFVQQTSDGGFVVTGTSTSFGTDLADLWILKLHSKGEIEWERQYGDSFSVERGRSIRQTRDGGYIVAGESSNGFISKAFLLHISSAGEIGTACTSVLRNAAAKTRLPKVLTVPSNAIVETTHADTRKVNLQASPIHIEREIYCSSTGF